METSSYIRSIASAKNAAEDIDVTLPAAEPAFAALHPDTLVINELIEDNMPRQCVLEFSGLSFMDSSGIAVVINAGKKMRSLGGKLSVENPAPQARKVLEASGIDRLIAVASNT